MAKITKAAGLTISDARTRRGGVPVSGEVDAAPDTEPEPVKKAAVKSTKKSAKKG